VLDGVSFRVAAGERVALVGPSGAGKTTLTDLVAGLYRPQRGAILIDGIDLATVAPSSVQRLVRGVAVDSLLFRGSIAENVRFGRFDASDADVVDAIKMAGLSTFVQGLPDGLGTLVGERGVQLSAGERQRILLARAFLAQPRILLLDEATANLDYRTEADVKKALSRAARGRTTLLVAHRKSMLTDVDRVVVIRNGKVEQDGTPDELRAVDGYFRQLMEADDRH
jgi:ABC-type multidrug transport system fused ATPase/permease subunit